eukprot:TRINITY_DN10978_c0_g1_i1.p1 TRINITY_DN10978_c0_g1~~TRINITY_DN10978_c0_g1_i1.p1  ORF type:complete len:502 (-),score=84.66 TRINITY_DN10978_c0_g1_i1:72-1577(-)
MDSLFNIRALVFMFLSISLLNSPTSDAAPESALITHVPGFTGTLPSKHYAGYVNIDESDGKNLYYYFVVSEGKPSEDPVVLWLNGGPGCSSFDGFVYEHGPFNFQAGSGAKSLPQLHLNPYSWSKVSSVLYLDSPAGVGLSYADNQDAYNTGDFKTASDTHTFLLKWFKQYPEFLTNPFYISGESYAGVYVPTLASEVAKGIKAGLKPTLNFKGYMVGNGVTDTEIDGNALVPFAHGMALISDDLFKEVTDACQGNFWNPIGSSCEANLEKVDQELNNLNIYDILEPCYHSVGANKIETNDSRIPNSFRKLGETERPLAVRKRMFGRSWPLRAPVKDGLVPTWPELAEMLGSSGVPCTDDEVATVWLNNDEVRKAIHAQQRSKIGDWELCTSTITYHHDAGSMIKYHRNLTAQGYRALVFSGDHDMCVPYTGSAMWTRSMGYKIVDEWRPWIVDEQVAGYSQGYEHNLIFLTIKGAGHTVPEYKPKEALTFYSRWLAGKPI